LKFKQSLKNISGNTEIINPEWELSEKDLRKPKHLLKSSVQIMNAGGVDIISLIQTKY
jgi:hypothetical protein